jgi:hypothetical protein
MEVEEEGKNFGFMESESHEKKKNNNLNKRTLNRSPKSLLLADT